MAVDLAVVGVDFRTEKVKEGEAVTVRAFGNIGDAAQRMDASIDKVNKQLQATSQAQQRATVEARATATAQTVAATGAQASAAQYEQARVALQRMGMTTDQVTAALQKMGLAEQQATASTARVTAAKTSAAAGTMKFQNALQAAALSLSGIPGPIGRVVSSLSTLAVGGVVTVGIVAGLSAIVTVLSKIGEESREAKRRTDELIASLREAEREKRGVNIAEASTDINTRIARQRNILDRIDPRTAGAADFRLKTEQELNRLLEGRRLLAQAEQDRLADLARAYAEDLKRRSDAARRLTNEARAAHEERVRQLAQIRQSELERDLARATAAQDYVAIEAALWDLGMKAIAEQLAAAGRLNAAERERLELLGRQNLALQLNAEARRRAETGATRLTHPNYLAQNNNAVQIQVDFEKATRAMAEKEWLELRREMQRRADEEAKQRYEAALRTTSDAFQRGFTGIFENGISGFTDFFKAVEQLGVQAASSIAAAMAVEALGIDDLLKRLTSKDGGGAWGGFGKGFTGKGSFAANVGVGIVGGQLGGAFGASQSSGFAAGSTGLLSGAALGAAGGVPGIIVGGVTGMITGLLGQGERAREAARRMAEAQKAFDLALQSYIASVSGDQLTQALLGNQAKADELIKQAENLARERFRQLSAGDLSDGAAADIFRDLAEQIDQITAASKALEGQLKAEAEARRQTVTEDLQVRALRAQGRDAEAEALALSLQHARERAVLEKELGDQFTATLSQQLAYVQALEVEAVAKAKAEEAARKAAELAEKQAMLRQDLEVRALAASGDTAGAEALRRRIAYEREYAEAVKAGMDETTLAMLKNVQAAEELAIAQGEAAKKAQDLIDAMNAEARAMENLEVRHYRAIGQHDFAEEARMRFEHEEEQRRAIEEGRSDAYMAWLKTVQQEEKDAFTKQRQDQQQKAFEDAVRSAFPADAKFLDDKTSVNLAVGVSESTVNRMVGVLQSQLVYQASLPRIESVLNRMEGILRGIRDGTLDLDAIDQGLAVLSADSDRAAGVPPGNR